jgi:hypothetical protein
LSRILSTGQNDRVVDESDLSNREHEQSKLRPDLEVVRRYGESHADVRVGEQFEWEPPQLRLVATFSDDVAAHEAALRRLVAFPEQLAVRWSPYPAHRLEEIRAEATDMARSTEMGSISGSGISNGRVRLSLWASQEDLAQRLHARYGRAVDLTVGYLHYPDRALLRFDGTPLERPTVDRPPLLPADQVAVTVPEPLHVRSGHHLRSELWVHNLGATDIVVNTNGIVTAMVVDPETNERVGGYEGAQTLPLVRYTAFPGQTVKIPLLIGTACAVGRLGYATPPGDWAIEVILGLGDERGWFITPHLPLTVT